MPYSTDKINSLLGGSGQTVGLTIDPTGRTPGQMYFFENATLTTLNSPVVIDIETEFNGQKGSNIDLLNMTQTDGSNFTLEYSYDGVTYEPPIKVTNTFAISELAWIPFSKLRLTRVSADAEYWLKVV